MSAHPGKAIAVRKSHKKSRTGCYTCKQRHVKCDEGKPVCENCSRRGMSCSFPHPEHQSPPESASLAEESQWSALDMLRNSASQPSNSRVSTPIQPAAPGMLCTSTASTSCSTTLRFSTDDMSLLYYYTVHTSLTLADLPKIVEIYALVAPKIAFSDPSLLLSMLAIAALHRAHVDSIPERQEEYVRQAAEYQTRSIGMLRARLADITPENCAGAFLSSSFLSIYTFASKPWSRHLSSATPSEGCVDDVVRSLRLLRGVPSILSHDNHAVFGWIMESPLRPIADGFLQKPKGRFTPEQESHFVALHCFLIEDPDAGEEERHAYLEALHVLREYAELLLDRQVQQQIETVGLTLTWPVVVSERYLAYLESHRRGAFLLLAEYAVLFSRLRRYWWAEAWGQTLLTVTLELLPDDWRCSILQFHDESLREIN